MKDYRYPFDCHVVSRALWLALHDPTTRAPLRFPGGNDCALRFSPRGVEWRESVNQTHSR